MKMTFESWCAKNYYKLRERLSLQGLFDEDAYQDAYLSILSRVRKGEQILCYDKHITNAYQAYRKKHISEGFVYVRPDELLFTLLPDNAPLPMEKSEGKPYYVQMVKEIKSYVKHNYSPTLVLAWETRRINLMSYVDISAFTGIAEKKVKHSIISIDADIREHFANSYKRRQRRLVL